MQANPRPLRMYGDESDQRAILALLLAGDPMCRTVPELA